jgi:hypothetical protein
VPADLRGRLLAGLSATAGVDTEALQ